MIDVAIFTLAAAVIMATLIMLGAIWVGMRRIISEVLNTKIPAGGSQKTLADLVGDMYVKVAGLPAGEEFEGLLKDLRKMLTSLPAEEIEGLIKDLRKIITTLPPEEIEGLIKDLRSTLSES